MGCASSHQISPHRFSGEEKCDLLVESVESVQLGDSSAGVAVATDRSDRTNDSRPCSNNQTAIDSTKSTTTTPRDRQTPCSQSSPRSNGGRSGSRQSENKNKQLIGKSTKKSKNSKTDGKRADILAIEDLENYDDEPEPTEGPGSNRSSNNCLNSNLYQLRRSRIPVPVGRFEYFAKLAREPKPIENKLFLRSLSTLKADQDAADHAATIESEAASTPQVETTNPVTTVGSEASTSQVEHRENSGCDLSNKLDEQVPSQISILKELKDIGIIPASRDVSVAEIQESGKKHLPPLNDVTPPNFNQDVDGSYPDVRFLKDIKIKAAQARSSTNEVNKLNRAHMTNDEHKLNEAHRLARKILDLDIL